MMFSTSEALAPEAILIGNQPPNLSANQISGDYASVLSRLPQSV